MFLTARQICEGALRRIGAYSINDAAARPQDMDVALQLLDDLVGELSGTMECTWLLTSTLSLALEADTASYDLKTKLGTAWPAQGIEYVREAWIEDETGTRGPIEIATRTKFENQSPQDQTGQPCLLHFDRLVPLPTMRVWPVPVDAAWTLKLVIQTLSPTVRGTGPIPKADQTITSTLPSSWNRWAIHALAADCGSGPVRALQQARTSEYRAVAAQSKAELMAFQNREHETTPPITGSMDVLRGSDMTANIEDRW